ncbi:hypothetical protein TeGR_g1680 [Tetraparma gracilis]|uniref:Uncharacterized protein n=1 Tax=Tetraparma gracilis TaxID=2962635 RepID=A0ABQ6N747_9STRA|nr:hypothetical protein TeGR_g1680 [Tetraparma gracilis]
MSTSSAPPADAGVAPPPAAPAPAEPKRRKSPWFSIGNRKPKPTDKNLLTVPGTADRERDAIGGKGPVQINLEQHEIEAPTAEDDPPLGRFTWRWFTAYWGPWFNKETKVPPFAKKEGGAASPAAAAE